MHTNLIHVHLSKYMEGGKPLRGKMDIVYEQIYMMYGFKKEQIRERNKNAVLVHARQAFCYLARKCAKIKLIDIAHELGQDHTNIIFSVNSMQRKIDTDYNNSRDQINRMINNLKFAF